MTLLEVGSAVFEEAGRLDPRSMRNLDAVHLALAPGDDLEGLVTYDERLAAARANGVDVVAPA